MDYHSAVCARIAFQVKRSYEQKLPFKIYHGTTNSTRKTVVSRTSVIDTSSLSQVLDVNTATKTALVEPNVSMDRLVQSTLKYGLLPKVIPEVPAITLGGAIAGTAGESSSFKYGFVSETVDWMEIILANGDITKASNAINPDLFDGVVGTYGSVAIVTLIGIQLIEAKQHVQLTYSPVNSVSELLWRIRNATEDHNNDFVDAIHYELNRGVVVSGRFVHHDESGEEMQRYSRARDEW